MPSPSSESPVAQNLFDNSASLMEFFMVVANYSSIINNNYYYGCSNSTPRIEGDESPSLLYVDKN